MKTYSVNRIVVLEKIVLITARLPANVISCTTEFRMAPAFQLVIAPQYPVLKTNILIVALCAMRIVRKLMNQGSVAIHIIKLQSSVSLLVAALITTGGMTKKNACIIHSALNFKINANRDVNELRKYLVTSFSYFEDILEFIILY